MPDPRRDVWPQYHLFWIRDGRTLIVGSLVSFQGLQQGESRRSTVSGREWVGWGMVCDGDPIPRDPTRRWFWRSGTLFTKVSQSGTHSRSQCPGLGVSLFRDRLSSVQNPGSLKLTQQKGTYSHKKWTKLVVEGYRNRVPNWFLFCLIIVETLLGRLKSPGTHPFLSLIQGLKT